jgi:hypothetical protein
MIHAAVAKKNLIHSSSHAAFQQVVLTSKIRAFRPQQGGTTAA